VNRVGQWGANAGRDMAGRDIVNNYGSPPPPGLVEKLLQKLEKQIANNETSELIEDLVRYQRGKVVDGIVGLQQKLDASDQAASYLDAIEKKEMFAKLLERYALYSSAQQIFAHFLAKVETEFNSVIYPGIPARSITETNIMIMDRIVHPIVEEFGCGIFTVTANHVYGMVYWLAELCFIRWHQPVS